MARTSRRNIVKIHTSLEPGVPSEVLMDHLSFALTAGRCVEVKKRDLLADAWRDRFAPLPKVEGLTQKQFGPIGEFVNNELANSCEVAGWLLEPRRLLLQLSDLGFVEDREIRAYQLAVWASAMLVRAARQGNIRGAIQFQPPAATLFSDYHRTSVVDT